MTVRELALKLLDEYELEGKYINLSLQSYTVRALSVNDKARLTSLLYTAVEHKLTYDYLISSLAGREIDKIDVHTKNILRLGMCQILHISSIPDFAAANETVKLARHKGERAFVNGILRSLVRHKEEGTIPMPKREKNEARYLSVAYSYPLWIVKHFISLFGYAECEELFRAFGKEAGMDLTVNTNKISREELIRLFSDSGIEAKPSKLSSISVKLERSYDPRTLPGFDDGYFFVQDEACALSSEVLGTKEGDTVVDTCAAPGGKSFAASILSHGRGCVYALDIHENKLSLIESGAERLGFNNIEYRACDARVPREELIGTADRVICDAPCSGLGVLGKKPDIRYRDKESVEELPKLQYSILEASSGYLKSGGTLVYSTCTVNPEENERIAERFLREHPDFRAVPFSYGDKRAEGGMALLLPHRDGTDGFFIAKFEKVN